MLNRISHCTCETSEFPNFEAKASKEQFLLPSCRSQQLLSTPADIPRASQPLACRASSRGWKLVCSSLLAALKTMISSSSGRMDEAVWRDGGQNSISFLMDTWEQTDNPGVGRAGSIWRAALQRVCADGSLTHSDLFGVK